MNFNEAPEFQKDVKRLTKKWPSIQSDIEAAKRYIVPLYRSQAEDLDVALYRQDFFNGKRAAVIKTTENAEVIKMRLDVADLERNDEVRLIFVAVKTEDTITLIELYTKDDKERENAKRIKKYCR